MIHQWKVICNPKSANGKARKHWPLINKLLKEQQIHFHHSFSQHKYHAIQLAQQAYEKGFRHFIVIGGDGSFHEVVNGIANCGLGAMDECEFALIPVGKGNDWARTHHIPKNYEQAICIIANHHTGKQDLGKLTFTNTGAAPESRYFINMVGIGFDAFVARAIGERFERGSRFSTVSYTLQLVRSLFTYRSQRTEIHLNGQEIRSKLFTLAAGIGRYNGGGMKQCPQAITDDGLLDVTIVDHVAIPVVIANLHRLFNGRFVKRKEVHQFRTKEVEVQAESKLLVEADGEMLGTAPTTIKIIDKKVRVVLPSYP